LIWKYAVSELAIDTKTLFESNHESVILYMNIRC